MAFNIAAVVLSSGQSGPTKSDLCYVCTYVYIHMYICIWVCIYMGMYIYIYIYIHIYIYIYIHMYVNICMIIIIIIIIIEMKHSSDQVMTIDTSSMLLFASAVAMTGTMA